MTEPEARERIEAYLDNTHAILWLNWDIGPDQNRTAAVDWMIEFLQDLGLVDLPS